LQQRLKNQPHYLSKAILLAPAGIHKERTTLMKGMGFLSLRIARVLHLPWYYVGFTSNTSKILATKIIQDFKNHQALKALLSYFVSYFILGGNPKDNPVQYVHNLVYHTFNATSTKVLQHFQQMHETGEFCSFDYGRYKNLEVYGQKTPLNFVENYDKIDIPVHIMYSKNDKVIPEECCLAHYNAMMNKCPNLARLTAFEDLGHIELTMNQNTIVIEHILDSIMERKSEPNITREDFYKMNIMN
jgi:pimeloyl-ACP methyl ester carboxylesterase